MLISKLFARNADAMVVAAAVAEVADFGLGCAHLFIESSRTSGATTVFHLFCNHLKRTSREKDLLFLTFCSYSNMASRSIGQSKNRPGPSSAF